MTRTRARGGGRDGGRGGGHAGPQPKSSANGRRTRQKKPIREDTPPVVNETNSVHSDERVMLEPAVKEAIVDEKCKEKVGSRGTTRKDNKPKTVFSSDEDSDGVLVRYSARVNLTTFWAAVELNGKLYDEREKVRQSKPKKTRVNNNSNGKRFWDSNHKPSEEKFKVEGRHSKGENSYEISDFRHIASHCPKGKSNDSGKEEPSDANANDKPKAKGRAYNISMKAMDHPKDVSGTF
ncbi:hypothetical protein L1987_05967 [Smallanthus sonchifolius]|uniref:Uncharacterized protein n=1 Tax=Smallanthus sonchifolius TaxID=185202 RepID=A0ACB9JWZ6_9ASTR|nr:hypothetical protein L1987_05967 [Smallanthus sonchifolius]